MIIPTAWLRVLDTCVNLTYQDVITGYLIEFSLDAPQSGAKAVLFWIVVTSERPNQRCIWFKSGICLGPRRQTPNGGLIICHLPWSRVRLCGDQRQSSGQGFKKRNQPMIIKHVLVIIKYVLFDADCNM